MIKIPYQADGDNLLCVAECSCGQAVKFAGYNTDEFFLAFKYFKEKKCPSCNAKWMFRWKLDGLEIAPVL